jgi:hypothetical protein
VAWVLDVSVNGAMPFEGSAEEARSLVLSENLHRRHLNTVQRAALIRRHVLPALKAEAEERMKAGKADPAAAGRKGRASTTAAALSGGMVSDSTIDRLAVLDDAPRTFERVMLGELTKVPAIRKAAEVETVATMTRAEKAAHTRAKNKAASGKAGTTKRRKNVDAILTRWESEMDDLAAAWNDGLFGTSFEDCADRLIELRTRMAMVEENGNGEAEVLSA